MYVCTVCMYNMYSLYFELHFLYERCNTNKVIIIIVIIIIIIIMYSMWDSMHVCVSFSAIHLHCKNVKISEKSLMFGYINGFCS